MCLLKKINSNMDVGIIIHKLQYGFSLGFPNIVAGYVKKLYFW
jgi:hypothetical protein